jgi:addiction module antitoxin, relB/dinJ family
VDEETRREAARIAEDLGFDLPSVTRAFYRQIVRENRLPLAYLAPNTESREALREADEIITRGTSRFTSREECYAELGI